MSLPAIVVVDDDPDKRFLLERFLRRNFPHNEASFFSDCATAATLVNAPIPKIVITNGRIAEKDGIEFAAYIIREVHAPVVVISLREELKERALAAGVSAFLESTDETEARDIIAQALSKV